MEPAKARFGCQDCLPIDAAAAGEALRHIRIARELIRESHYSILIRTCPSCQQAFVSIFTERIDWQDGEDPQRWLVMPLTPEETQRLTSQPNAASLERSVQLIAPDRQSLCLDHPKGSPPRQFWTRGIRIGLHD